MSLKIIGAGFGRTGTLSLKAALELLGLGPCYHMVEVFQNPDHTAIWSAAVDGTPPDWRAFLKDYRSAVDWPVCHFWRELAEAFPQAKILLSERDADAWYEIISKTIFEQLDRVEKLADVPIFGAQTRMAHTMLVEKTFDGRLDRDHVISVYKAHSEVVKRAVPRERLLVYDVAQGWEPLCAFLDVAVPAAPFPRTNSTAEFRAKVSQL